MQRPGAIPAFCLPQEKPEAPQNLQSSKQRKGVRNKTFGKRLQNYAVNKL